MVTVKENWSMPAYVGQECDTCDHVIEAQAWYDSLGVVYVVASCNCEISNIPWPLDELRGDFRSQLEALGFTWTQNPNED